MNLVSRLGIQNETIIRRQNALYSECNFLFEISSSSFVLDFQYLLSIYHEASIVSTRMIKIVSFTHEISIVHEAHNDMYAIANIFLPRYEKTNWISKPEPDAANSSLNLNKWIAYIFIWINYNMFLWGYRKVALLSNNMFAQH